MKPRKPAARAENLAEALEVLKKELPGRPLFLPHTRRYIPMRHRALGVLLGGENHPGLPTGCFVEVLGRAGAGKTTLLGALADAVINQPAGATHRVYEAGKPVDIPAPRRVAIIDYEQVLDLRYLQNQVRNCELAQVDDRGKLTNAKTANVFVHQPDTLEEGVDILIRLIECGEFGMAAIDSVAAMLPAEEAAKRMDEATMGLLARSMGKMFRKCAPSIRRYGTSFVCINQWRSKLGVSFGDPRTSPGGGAAEFWDAIKLDLSGTHKTEWFPDGKIVQIKAMKNKVSGVRRTVRYHLGHGVGISAEVELLEAALACGVAEMPARKVYLVPKHAKGKIVSARREFPDASAFLAAARSSEKLFTNLWSLCEAKGVSSFGGPASSGSGFEED